MYQTAAVFVEDWQKEREETAKLFKCLTNSSLHTHISGYNKTAGKLAWHITQTLTELGSKLQIFSTDALEGVKCPATVDEMVSIYQQFSEKIATIVSGWDTAFLHEEIEIYGMKATRSQCLVMMVKHEIHHRAQLTVLIRQLGLKPIGIYGPTEEEWANYKQNPPE